MLIGDAIQLRQEQNTVSSLFAYLIGVKREHLDLIFEEHYKDLSELENNPTAKILRSLCIIRSKLLCNFLKTENAIVYDLKNLNTLDEYKEDVKILEKLDVPIIKTSCRVNKYIVHINSLIVKYVDLCHEMFPEWVDWQIIRKLFIMPNGTKEDKIKDESTKYNSSRNYYPYSQYINWYPKDEGNILKNDKKFLSVIYAQNGKYFEDNNKVRDANKKIKTNIYNFIDNNESTALVVDCENSDPYKLYAVLKNLNQNETNKIKKIILYDDKNTTSAWKNMEKFAGIPFEYVLVERVNEYKSLVDLKMSIGITESFYRDNITSFILVSSDSDYWAIISSIPQVKFLVMIENAKCGIEIKNALDSKGIYYCSIDDFCSGNINDFKSFCLLYELDKRIDNIIELNSIMLLESVYESCRLEATKVEKKNFYDKYIKKLKLQINSENDFYIARE